MRKQQHTMFLPLLVFTVVVGAAAAQTPAAQPVSQRNELERVSVIQGADGVRVEINSRGALAPKLSSMDSPERIVVDLPRTVMASGQSHIDVGASGVKDVRIGMDKQVPPNTRIVVDLDKACTYELTPGTAGKLVLTLHAQETALKTPAFKSPAQTTVAQNTPAPVAAPASPFAPRVVETQTTKTDSKSAVAPTDFAFVEPSYQVKKDNSTKDDAVVEPQARAQEAAARFSDKTAAELLPVSAHAQMAAASNAPTTPRPGASR